MLPSVLLLIFGKLQDYVGRNGPVWPWALSYGLCLGVAGFVVVGGEMSPIAAAAFGFYCWAYLVLLRQWRGERARWLGVYWFGALLPLVIDLTNPSPALGWAHRERDSMLGRGPVDLVMALALLHHLAISNNVPLETVARFMAEAGEWAIVEFVPKSDSQVKRLLATRKDIFDQYTEQGFEEAFLQFFTLEQKAEIAGSQRTLYLFRRRQ